MIHDLIFNATDKRIRSREQLTCQHFSKQIVYNESTQNIPLTAVREQWHEHIRLCTLLKSTEKQISPRFLYELFSALLQGFVRSDISWPWHNRVCRDIALMFLCATNKRYWFSRRTDIHFKLQIFVSPLPQWWQLILYVQLATGLLTKVTLS